MLGSATGQWAPRLLRLNDSHRRRRFNCCDLSSVIREPDDAQARYRRQPPIIGNEHRTPGLARSRQLQSIRRPHADQRAKLRGSSQLLACHVDQSYSSAAGQQRFIARGKSNIVGGLE